MTHEHEDHEQQPDPDADTSSVISPGTPVHLSVRTAIALLVSIVVLVGSAVASYAALAATDRDSATRIHGVERQLEGTATKEDIRSLRLQVQMDLLSSVWFCLPNGTTGGMQCRPQLVR